MKKLVAQCFSAELSVAVDQELAQVIQIHLHPSLCRCVLGQDTSPILPCTTVSECWVVIRGAI